jgi:RHS repeat-associated protein
MAVMARAFVGHPVDVATGIVHGTYNDLFFPGRVALTWTRIFRTPQFQKNATPLGSGWTVPYFARVAYQDGDYLVFTPEGDTVIFPGGDGAGQVLRNLGVFSELSIGSDHLSLLRWDPFRGAKDRLVFARHRSTADWLVVAIQTPDGQGLDLTHDRQGRVIRIAQRREGRALQVIYDEQQPERLASLEFVASNGDRRTMVEHRYDQRGRLVEVMRHPDALHRYAYDEFDRLTVEDAPSGGRFFFSYDARHRCVHTFGQDGYDERRLRYLDHIRWTEVTDSHGAVRRFQWNAEGQIVRQVSPLNAETLLTYDDHGRLTARVEPSGTTTGFEFDAIGDLRRLVVSGMPVYEASFGDGHFVTDVRTSAGAHWQLSYSSIGRLQSVVEPKGLAWRLVWSGEDVQEVQASCGAVWRYEHNGQGQLLRISNGAGAEQSYRYDERGFTAQATSPDGSVTQFLRDELGRALATTYPDGSVVTKTYSPCGLLESVSSEAGRVLTIRYDKSCTRIASIQYADGTSVTYQWGSESWELQGVSDRQGGNHQYAYNEDGFLVSHTEPDGRPTWYIRNAAGDIVRKDTGIGSTSYSRDVAGRIRIANFPDGTSANFDYDDNGFLTQAAYDGTIVGFERDQLGRRTRETGSGYSISTEYHAAGGCARVEMSPGFEVLTEYSPYGAPASIASPGRFRMAFSVDAVGREVRRDFVVGSGRLTVLHGYDSIGRLAVQHAIGGDEAGVGSRSPRVLVGRQYDYDRLGHIQSVFHSLWGRTTFTHDLANRVLRATDDDRGATEEFRYDANGNLLSMRVALSLAATDFDQLASVPASEEVLEYAFGRLNQTSRERFVYDADGRITERERLRRDAPTLTTRYEWNGLGLISALTLPDGTRWTYRYDALGRRISKEGPSGITRFIYDGNTLCLAMSEQGGFFEQWVYTPGTYAPIAKIERRETYAVLTDRIGTPTELLDAFGEIRWSGKYSLWGQLQDERKSGADCLLRFPGQWFDAESGLHYNNFRFYDPRLGRYLSPDPIPMSPSDNVYTYVPNPLWWIDPLGLVATYNPVDNQGRPTGAFADLTQADRNTGTPATRDPPGWNPGGPNTPSSGEHPDHMQRSHLIAGSLGGSGSDPANIVAMTDGSNHPGMSIAEGRIRAHLDADPNNRVLMEVTVQYDGDNPTPRSVRIYAIDKDGNVIYDDTVMNGQRQKKSCCG